MTPTQPTRKPTEPDPIPQTIAEVEDFAAIECVAAIGEPQPREEVHIDAH